MNRLDLECELDDHDPPVKVGRVTFDDTSHKQIKTSVRAKVSVSFVAEVAEVVSQKGVSVG